MVSLTEMYLIVLYKYIYSYFNNIDRSKPKAYETRPEWWSAAFFTGILHIGLQGKKKHQFSLSEGVP